MYYVKAKGDLFLSTLSLRRATTPAQRRPRTVTFLSTLSLRRATYVGTNSAGLNVISIHALLAESDPPPNIDLRYKRYFYPRSPCGERLADIAAILTEINISIHALLAESDTVTARIIDPTYGFLSTLSLRRATLARK